MIEGWPSIGNCFVEFAGISSTDCSVEKIPANYSRLSYFKSKCNDSLKMEIKNESKLKTQSKINLGQKENFFCNSDTFILKNCFALWLRHW